MPDCICPSFDLLNYGCRCGFLKKKSQQSDTTVKPVSITITARQFIVGGIRIGFKVFGNNEVVNIEFHWKKKKSDGSIAWQPADLINPSHGLIVLPMPNCVPRIEGLTADGKTEYWVHWNTNNHPEIKSYGIRGPDLRGEVKL